MNIPLINNTKGSIGLLTALVLSSALVIITVSMLMMGISSRTNAFMLNQSDKVFISMEGCAEESLIQLNRNHDYSGGNYSMGGVSCTSSVSGSDDNRDIVVSVQKEGITRDAVIRVQLVPVFAIIEWSE